MTILFFQVFLKLAGGILAVALVLIASRIISTKASLLRLKKLTKGLPILEGASLLGGHIDALISSKENCRNLMEAHERHGPNICGLVCDNYFMSTIDLDLIKRITFDEAHLHLDRFKFNVAMGEMKDSIMLLPGHRWKSVRRVFAPAVKSSKFKAPNVRLEVEQSIGKLVSHIERLIDPEAPSQPGPILEADNLAHKYAFDLVFSCFYKQRQEIDFDNPKEAWTSLMHDGLQALRSSVLIMQLPMIFPWFNSIIDWFTWHFSIIGVIRKEVHNFVDQMTDLCLRARQHIEKLKRQGESVRDENDFILEDGTRYTRNMADGIIDAFLDGKISRDDYFNTTIFMLAAASSAPADCIIHTLYLLSVHQDIQERVRECIKAEGADAEYLSWVLHESLRLLPPAPTGCSRTVSRPIELESGHVVPAGTYVVTNAFAIHRLKKYWGEDANEFKPERWRDTSKHHPLQFLAFGAGQRGCLGRDFALFQMKMLFAALLSRFRFQGAPREDVYKFSSPGFAFINPYSHTRLTITRVPGNLCGGQTNISLRDMRQI